jgi:parallel beta-helix repeat protein
MNKLFILSVLVLFFLIFIISPTTAILLEKDTLFNEMHFENVIYVDDDNIDGPWEGTHDYPYQYIQQGIDNANNGSTIIISSGIYYENIIIDKRLTLSGTNITTTIIDGGYEGFVVHVLEDRVSIINLTIRNSGGYLGDAGILFESNYNLISNCIIYRTKTGIYINENNEHEINNCTFRMNGEGIFLKSSNRNIIETNILDHNSIGINIDHSYENTIKFSYMYANGIACFLNDSSNIEIKKCNISDNSANMGGIFIIACSEVDIIDCIIRHNGAGISTALTEKISIINCDILLNTIFQNVK